MFDSSLEKESVKKNMSTVFKFDFSSGALIGTREVKFITGEHEFDQIKPLDKTKPTTTRIERFVAAQKASFTDSPLSGFYMQIPEIGKLRKYKYLRWMNLRKVFQEEIYRF